MILMSKKKKKLSYRDIRIETRRFIITSIVRFVDGSNNSVYKIYVIYRQDKFWEFNIKKKKKKLKIA